MGEKFKRFGAAMIIGMALVFPAHAQWWAGGEVRLPDPAAFSNQMELGDVRAATAWLDAGLPPDFMGSRIGSGLMIGAWNGNLELMRLFLARGADINQRNNNGESALALAAWQGKKAAVEWLLAHGASINVPDKYWSPLHYAVFGGHDAVAELLLERGANLDARSPNGSSVLMMAVYEGREAIARKLLSRGARTDVRNDWGDGAMEWAMRNNNLNLARLLGDPAAFREAASKPREAWADTTRSLAMSKDLEAFLAMRKTLLERGMSTEAIDRRIAAERARLVRERFDTPALKRATTLEVTASQQRPGEQSVRVLREGEPVETGQKSFKVPPPTYFGTPKMPPKAPVRNF